MRDFFYLLSNIAVIIISCIGCIVGCIASGYLLKKKRPEKTVKIFIPIREYKLYYIFALIFFFKLDIGIEKVFYADSASLDGFCSKVAGPASLQNLHLGATQDSAQIFLNDLW
jgi:hypothetical protein